MLQKVGGFLNEEVATNPSVGRRGGWYYLDNIYTISRVIQ
jgi:hypothetical protein